MPFTRGQWRYQLSTFNKKQQQHDRSTKLHSRLRPLCNYVLCKSHFKWTHTHCSVWGKLHNMLTCDMLLMFTCKSKICFWCSHAKVKYAFDVHMQKYILCCKPRIWSEVTKPLLTIIVHFSSFDLFVDIFVICFSSNPGCPFTIKISGLPDSKFRA